MVDWLLFACHMSTLKEVLKSLGNYIVMRTMHGRLIIIWILHVQVLYHPRVRKRHIKSPTHSLAQLPIHSLTLPFTHPPSLTSPYPLTHSLRHSLKHSPPHWNTCALSHSLTHSPSLTSPYPLTRSLNHSLKHSPKSISSTTRTGVVIIPTAILAKAYTKWHGMCSCWFAQTRAKQLRSWVKWITFVVCETKV